MPEYDSQIRMRGFEPNEIAKVVDMIGEFPLAYFVVGIWFSSDGLVGNKGAFGEVEAEKFAYKFSLIHVETFTILREFPHDSGYLPIIIFEHVLQHFLDLFHIKLSIAVTFILFKVIRELAFQHFFKSLPRIQLFEIFEEFFI